MCPKITILEYKNTFQNYHFGQENEISTVTPNFEIFISGYKKYILELLC